MLFNLKHELVNCMVLNDEALDAVSSVKFLKIVDNKLPREDHTNELCKKLSPVLFCYGHYHGFCPESFLKLSYFRLFLSQLTYEIALRRNSSKWMTKKIISLQKY